MQNSFIYKYLSILFTITLLFVTSSLSAEENEGLVLKKVQLLNAKMRDKKLDPFTMFYPIEVTKPGRVYMDVQVTSHTSNDIKDERAPLRWYFVDSRFFNPKAPMKKSKFRKWAESANEYNPAEYIAGDELRGIARAYKNGINKLFGKKKQRKAMPAYYHRGSAKTKMANSTGPKAHYDIDQTELMETGGMYFLVVQNYSRNIAPEFKIEVSFPGTQRLVDEDLLPRSDLGIRKIWLSEGQVFVSVQNNGNIELPHKVYSFKGENAFTLMVHKDGKSWGGTTLNGLDPKKSLAKPGGKAAYIFDMKIDKPTKITAILKTPRFKDSNKRNNKKTVTLKP